MSTNRCSVPLIGVLIIIISCKGVSTSPVADVGRRMWQRSISDNGADDLCYPMELENTTKIELIGQTTALFKLTKYSKFSWDVIMIQELKDRLAARGYNEANLVIIIPGQEPTTNDEDLGNSTTQSPSLPKSNQTGVTIIYDNEDLEHLAGDSVTVVDICGIVAYTIFQPWSSMEYPYVKAAILSTMFDLPCGASCEKAAAAVANPLRHPLANQPPSHNGIVLDLDAAEKEARQVTDDGIALINSHKGQTNEDIVVGTTPSTLDEDSSYVIPMRIIIPAEHVHKDAEDPPDMFRKYNYFVLSTDNESYHGHLDSDPAETFWRDPVARLNPIKEEEPEMTTMISTTNSPDEIRTETEEISTSTMTTLISSSSDPEASSETEPLLSISGSTIRIAFSLSTTNDIGTTPPVSTKSQDEDIDPLLVDDDRSSGTTTMSNPTKISTNNNVQYVNSNREKYKVLKKYRFGDLTKFNEINFDEVEVIRPDVETFVTHGPERVREVDEHYELMLPWLDYNL